MIKLKSLLEQSRGRFQRPAPADRAEMGLMVTGRTQLDNNKIGDLLDGLGLHAEWEVRHGYWFFPEDEESYGSLEALLDAEFAQHGINARIEGV
jgi:hypothetical protein